ncbi:leucine-rich PPR motif-containing protein, mitochondrial-like isoform X2 [Lycorma delicatula]|uniref:leucine-rich PPR motif-containing protein, mitochondrial-like isoform X2 n=1 Tax=Lycorma delicatula TaxID=130591 RepID=UPI003F5100C5
MHLYRSCLNLLSLSIKSKYYVGYLGCVNGCSKLTKKIIYKHEATARRYCTVIPNGKYSKQNLSHLEVKINASIDKYFDYLKSRIANCDAISKVEFKSILRSVVKEGCTADQGVMLLQCCAELLPDVSLTEKTDLVLSSWNIVKDVGCLSLDSYHALLTAFAKCHHVIKIEDILSEIREKGLIPTEKTYLKLLNCVAVVGDIDQVINVISSMKESGIPLNQCTFNHIILAYGRAGDLKEAENVLNLMRDSLIKPTASTYTTLLRIAAETGNESKFLSYLNNYQAEISCTQRLEVAKSLAMGYLEKMIPKILEGGAWNSYAGLNGAMVNTCTELIHAGHIDSALIIFNFLFQFIQNVSQSESDNGILIIQETVKSNAPIKVILEVCDRLAIYNSFSLLKATETALANDMPQLSIQLFESLLKQGYTLRPHYFWPLFVSAGKRDGEFGVLNMLKTMLHLGVTPNIETLAEWVCIHCDLSQPVELVRKLQDRGLSLNNVLSSVVLCLLFHNDLKGAAAVCSRYKTNLEWKKMVKLLSTAYLKTKDVSSLMAILKLVKEESAGDDLIEFILIQRQNPVENELLSKTVTALEKSGYSLSTNLLNKIDTVLEGGRMQNDMNSLNIHPSILHPREMKVDELEAHLIELKNKKMNTRGVLRHLLQHHSRLGNTRRVLEIKKELEDGGLKFSPGMLSSLLESFVIIGNLQEAENCLITIEKNYSNFNLDTYKLIDLATLYVKSGQYERGVDILSKKQEIKHQESFSRNCLELLNTVAENNGPHKTKEMLNLLIDKNYCNISNIMLGPLIRSHLIREDFIGAVNIYEKCALDHKSTPLQHEILCELIKREDQEVFDKFNENNIDNNKKVNVYTELLQKVISIGKNIHGDENTNVAYLVALAESGLVKKMNNFVKVSGSKINIGVLLARCKRLADENKPEAIKKIITAIKELPYIKCENFYNILLKVYDKETVMVLYLFG